MSQTYRVLLGAAEIPRAAMEGAALLAASPLLSLSKRGDGHPVLVLPGFAASDDSTMILRRFLQSRNFAAKPWGLGRNRGPRAIGGPEALDDLLAGVYEDSGGKKVSLIGWSLGGVYARGMAKRYPDRVRQVITLGSPITGRMDETAVWSTVEAIRGSESGRGSESDPCAVEKSVEKALERDAYVQKFFERNRQAPPGIPSTAIYSKTDGIVPWQIAQEEVTPLTDNIEVYASHLGLGFNASVYYALVDRLSQAENKWRPFTISGWRAALYTSPNRDSDSKTS